MKLILISNLYPSSRYPTYGTFVKNIAMNLQEEGVELKMIVKTKSSNKFYNFISYIQFYFRIIYSFKHVNEYFYYVHYANHSLLPFLISNKKVLSKLIVNFHGGDLFPRNTLGKIISLFTKQLIPKLNHFIVPSEYLKEELLNQFEMNEKSVFVSASGGIDTSLFKPISHPKNDILDIGFIGRLDRGKGFDILIDLSKELLNKSIKFHFHVIGDGEFKTLYKKQIRKIGAVDCFTFYGWKKQFEMPEIISQFDIFAFPSHSESLGLVGLEVMACGVPVIGSKVGGIKSYVIENYNGFLFNQGDVKELLLKIIYYIDLPDIKKRELSDNAIITASQYSKEKVGRDLYLHFCDIFDNN